MTTGVIIFWSCIGVYLVGLLVYTLVKRHQHKKKVQKEIKDEKESQDEVSSK